MLILLRHATRHTLFMLRYDFAAIRLRRCWHTPMSSRRCHARFSQRAYAADAFATPDYADLILRRAVVHTFTLRHADYFR